MELTWLSVRKKNDYLHQGRQSCWKFNTLTALNNCLKYWRRHLNKVVFLFFITSWRAPISGIKFF